MELIVPTTYHGKGWPPLPLPPQAKSPPPEGRTGATGVDMTLDEIRAAQWDGNIGVRMPVDVVGLDFDLYKPGGRETLALLIAECDPLPPTMVSHSGRNDGSGIRYFRAPAGMPWIKGLPGLDMIYHGYRYAVVAPSQHPDGRVYGWWDEQAEDRLTAPPLVEDLPELPWAWVAALSRATVGEAEVGTRGRPAAVDEVVSFIDGCADADSPGYLSIIVAHFVERRTAGYSRHDTMQHCLTWAMECARAGIMTAEQALAELSRVWTVAVGSDVRRAELHSTRRVTEFDAMLRWAIGKVMDKTPEEMGVLHDDIAGVRMNVPPPPAAEAQSADVSQAPPSVFTVMEFAELPDPFIIPVVEWHAAAFLARPTHAELAGAEKSLKSYTGLMLDVALAAGLPVLGRFEVVERQRVLLLVGEGGEGPWLRRFAAVCAAYGVEPGDLRGWVRYCSTTASVSSPRFVDSVRAELETFGPALVHLDPWYAYASGQADSRQVTEVGSQLAAFGELCSSNGASALINHHFNRTEQTGLRQITGAGHAEWVDSWLMVKHRTPAQPALGRYQLRLDVGSRQWGGNEYDLDVSVEPMTGAVGWHIVEASATGDDDEGDSLTQPKLDLLRTGRKARKALTRASWIERTKGRASTLRVAFDELVEEGRIAIVTTFKSGSNTVSTYEVNDS
jgi:hypothetical protein